MESNDKINIESNIKVYLHQQIETNQAVIVGLEYGSSKKLLTVTPIDLHHEYVDNGMSTRSSRVKSYPFKSSIFPCHFGDYILYFKTKK